jgi:Putative bacterial sensory transduction regulator
MSREETTMSANAKSPSGVIPSLTLQTLRENFQEAGYRVEALTDPVANVEYLRSATAGVAFDIRPGNRLAGDANSFADIALVAVLQIQGDVPPDLVNRWNLSRRFGRLQLSAPFLVFCLDVSVLNGVTPAHLRGQIELWDRLVQDLVPFLRTAFADAAAQKDKSTAPTKSDQPAAAA